MAKSKAYRVSAPYVTVTLLDDSGAEQVRGFYEGGILPASAKTESVEGLLVKGMVEEVDVMQTAEEQVVPPKNTIGVTPPKAPKVEKSPAGAKEATADPAVAEAPAATASKADWVAYAVSKRGEGMSEDEARLNAEVKSKNDLVAEFGG